MTNLYFCIYFVYFMHIESKKSEYNPFLMNKHKNEQLNIIYCIYDF
jgi:hypothetical protein